MSNRDPDIFVCPTCGREVPISPRGCPNCHPETDDPESESVYDGLDLPEDDDFDYDRFIADEFGGPGKRMSRKELFWWIVAIITLLAFVMAWVF